MDQKNSENSINISFLGTGGAFDFEYGNSSLIVEMGDMRILTDCGNIIYNTLRKKNLENSFGHILVTHLHDDHVGSLSSLFHHRKAFKGEKPCIICPNRNFKEELISLLKHSIAIPEENGDFLSIDEFPSIKAINTLGKHIPNMQTFAYYFIKDKQIVAYSGDLGDPTIIFEELKPYSSEYDISVFHDVSFSKNSVHAYYKDLEIYSSIGKIYGYHCNPTKAPEDLKIPLVYNCKEFLL